MIWSPLSLHVPSSSSSSSFVAPYKRNTPLVHQREETTKNTTLLLLCCSSYSRPGSCVHKNRESRPPKPMPFVSSSAWVKIGNQVFGSVFPATARWFFFLLLPDNLASSSDGGGEWRCNLIAWHRVGRLHRQPLYQPTSALVPLCIFLMQLVLCFLWLRWWLILSPCSLRLDHTCTCLMSPTFC